MADQKQATTDNITALGPAVTGAGPSLTEPLPDEPVIEPLELVEEPKARSKLRTYSILSALYLVLFVAALDQTIIATSIPTITSALHSATGYTWIGSAYLLASAAAGPIWAKTSDIWGRKPALLAAVLVFAIASMIAALSTSMRMLIAARALQGTACGGLGQMVYITISDLFSVRKRAMYVGLMGMMWGVAGSAGPLIGGACTQYVNWRWCFWINLPVCGTTLVLLLLFLDVHNPRTKLSEGLKAVDWFGTVTILGVTLLLLLGLDFGGATFPWSSPKVICLIVFGMVMIGFFLFSEKRLAKYPLMPLGVFNDWSNNAAFVLGFAHSMSAIGVEYYLPLYFQSVKQTSPLRSGLLILPMTITEATVDIGVGFLITRTGRYRELTWIGVTLMTLGTGLYIKFGIDTPIAEIAGFEIIAGIGTALLFQAPVIAIQANVSQANTAAATATLGFFNKMATSLSIVLGGVVFQNSMATRQASLADAGLSESVLNVLTADKAAANVDIVRTIQDATQRHVVQDAFAGSLRNMFILYTCAAALALVASAFIKQRHLSDNHIETKTGLKELERRAS
ncbi:MFS drug transporter [Polychaeton citri CBS 116435]|uniref:MFS drug transporter n=1 Tax=Polychaeton citri CBS 116435 TaxID=1314669 RepID=A0A9P4Q3F0_9PEZI|nr:MFS drug transporter [Polychaeton citri CBS 116435]